MDRIYSISLREVQIAGAAIDFVLMNPRQWSELAPPTVAELSAFRDLLETYNSESYVP